MQENHCNREAQTEEGRRSGCPGESLCFLLQSVALTGDGDKDLVTSSDIILYHPDRVVLRELLMLCSPKVTGEKDKKGSLCIMREPRNLTSRLAA